MRRKVVVALYLLAGAALLQCGGSGAGVTLGGLTRAAWMWQCHSLDVDLSAQAPFYTCIKFIENSGNQEFNVGKSSGAGDDGTTAEKRFLTLATDYKFVEQTNGSTVVHADCTAFDDSFFP